MGGCLEKSYTQDDTLKEAKKLETNNLENTNIFRTKSMQPNSRINPLKFIKSGLMLDEDDDEPHQQ